MSFFDDIQDDLPGILPEETIAEYEERMANPQPEVEAPAAEEIATVPVEPIRLEPGFLDKITADDELKRMRQVAETTQDPRDKLILQIRADELEQRMPYVGLPPEELQAQIAELDRLQEDARIEAKRIAAERGAESLRYQDAATKINELVIKAANAQTELELRQLDDFKYDLFTRDARKTLEKQMRLEDQELIKIATESPDGVPAVAKAHAAIPFDHRVEYAERLETLVQEERDRFHAEVEDELVGAVPAPPVEPDQGLLAVDAATLDLPYAPGQQVEGRR